MIIKLVVSIIIFKYLVSGLFFDNLVTQLIFVFLDVIQWSQILVLYSFPS